MKFTVLLASIATTIALSACGGGGDSAAAPVPTPSPPLVTTDLVSEVPAASYAAGSEELEAFKLLNAERQRCGFGLLKQDTRLDMASKSHADWIILNGIASHTESAGSAGFTGATSADRITATGYASLGSFLSQDEFSLVTGTTNKVGRGAIAIRQLLNAPYHATGLMEGWRDVGISIRGSNDVSTPYTAMVVGQVNPAYKTSEGLQQAPSGTVRTYPCEGSTGVAHVLLSEMPNPVPGRNLNTSPLGTNISILVNEGETLAITSATMINTRSGSNVPLRVPTTAANDPNGFMRSHKAFVIADAPMDVNSVFQATIAGSVNGTPFRRTFTFTTGNVDM